MAKVIGVSGARSAAQTIYDPTCGSGSLLLKAHDEAPYDLTIYGQEKDVATRALAKMNMVLHDCPTAEIWRGNTLSTPHFVNTNGSLKTFDFVVANPPFSDKAWSTGLDPANDQFERFANGVPPAKNGDFAYLLHVVASLKSTGKGAIILPHGVLFRGNAESEIRRKIIRKGFIKGIIGLPANLFYGTGIPACIVVLDKENAQTRTGIFMIDASKGFVKDGNKNRLRSEDLHKIVDAFTKQVEVDKFAHGAARRDREVRFQPQHPALYRLLRTGRPSGHRGASEEGGIPVRDLDALSDYWAVMPTLRDELFGPGDRPAYASPKIEPEGVKPAIFNHPEFAAFSAQVADVFAGWRDTHLERLKGIAIGDKPKQLIWDISEDLLARFKAVPLIDGYDIYQHLMNYWSEAMQDDVYVIAQDGWAAALQIRELVKNAEGKFTETPDITLGRKKLKAELIPPALIVARFFADEIAKLEALEAKAEEAARAIEELDEEHGGEEGLLFEAKTEKGKLTAKSVKDRIKDIRDDREALEEVTMLRDVSALLDAEKAASDAVKDAQTILDGAAVKRYAKLTEAEVKLLIVEDKWLAQIASSVAAEVDQVCQALAGRVKVLSERYSVALPQLALSQETLSDRVHAHLQQMGFAA
jgi:type I restriction enzyme M protein